ncbi:MAG: hypothetical protein ABH883_08815, partial [Candidatus Omnitrophota bacterium]
MPDTCDSRALAPYSEFLAGFKLEESAGRFFMSDGDGRLEISDGPGDLRERAVFCYVKRLTGQILSFCDFRVSLPGIKQYIRKHIPYIDSTGFDLGS